jgi:hypothetical protein
MIKMIDALVYAAKTVASALASPVSTDRSTKSEVFNLLARC